MNENNLMEDFLHNLGKENQINLSSDILNNFLSNTENLSDLKNDDLEKLLEDSIQSHDLEINNELFKNQNLDNLSKFVSDYNQNKGQENIQDFIKKDLDGISEFLNGEKLQNPSTKLNKMTFSSKEENTEEAYRVWRERVDIKERDDIEQNKIYKEEADKRRELEYQREEQIRIQQEQIEQQNIEVQQKEQQQKEYNHQQFEIQVKRERDELQKFAQQKEQELKVAEINQQNKEDWNKLIENQKANREQNRKDMEAKKASKDTNSFVDNSSMYVD